MYDYLAIQIIKQIDLLAGPLYLTNDNIIQASWDDKKIHHNNAYGNLNIDG